MSSNVFDALSVDEMTANLLESWARADATCRVTGKGWYPRANRFVVDLAGASGLSVERVAAMVAVLSPRSSWATNKVNTAATLVEAGWLSVDRAVTILQTYGDAPRGVWRLEAPQGLPGPIGKARHLAHGEDIAHCLGHGLKTNAFYDNLVHPKLSTEVTVDAWVAGAAAGRRLSNAEMSGLTILRYRKVAEAVRRAAGMVHLQGLTFQAIVWCEFRGRTGWGAARHQ